MGFTRNIHRVALFLGLQTQRLFIKAFFPAGIFFLHSIALAQSSSDGVLQLGAFLGSTKVGSQSSTTYGLTYLNRTSFFGGNLSLGAAYDMIQSEPTPQTRLLVLGVYKLFWDLSVGGGLGIQQTGETKNVVRLEASYVFRSESLMLVPIYAFEMGVSSATVTGVRLMYGF